MIRTAEFDELLLNAMPCMRLSARRFACNNDATLDLLQATALRAIEKHEGFTIGTDIKAWLYTIMRNIFISGYRDQKKAQRVNSTLWAIGEQPNSEDNCVGSMQLRQRIQEMVGAKKDTISLYIMGHRQSDISLMQGVSETTVKTRLHRARRFIKDSC